MYKSKKQNNLVHVIRANQAEHGITELTIFESDEYANPKVLFSGALDAFISVDKLEMGLYRFRQNILRRHVHHKIVFQKKLFIWLDDQVVYDRTDIKANMDKLIALLQEGKYEYEKAQQIQENIFKLLDKMGIYDPDDVSISVPNANNLTNAITNQIHGDEDWIGVIVDTIGKSIPKIETESA